MAQTRCRRFNLGDAMILVVAIAAGVALTRMFFKYTWPRIQELAAERAELAAMPGAVRHSPWPDRLDTAGLVVSIWLAPMSLAILAMRVRKPRPSLRRVSIQPGFLACLSAAVIILAEGIIEIVNMAVLGLPNEEYVFDRVIRFVLATIGVTVAALWIGQAIGRRWRGERNWIDRTGRLIGILWIAVFLENYWSVSYSTMSGYLWLKDYEQKRPSDLPLPTLPTPSEGATNPFQPPPNIDESSPGALPPGTTIRSPGNN